MSDSTLITNTEIDLKEVRKNQLKLAVESSLQHLITDAAKLKKTITESKTVYKKTFYTKKFNKVKQAILQYTAVLQRLDSSTNLEGSNNETTE